MMDSKNHIGHEDLIDFIEGELSPERARRIGAHIGVCETCRSYVESIKATFGLLARDSVPEPPPGYWVYLPQRAKGLARSRRRRLLLALAPGLAAVLVAAVLLWWPGKSPVRDLDSVDLMLSEMSTDEIIETLSGSPAYEEMVLEAAEDEISTLEGYLFQTEDIYDLVNMLSDDEKDALASELSNLMGLNENTSKLMIGPARKGC